MPTVVAWIGIAASISTVAKASCGPALTFFAREKELLADLNITPEQHCSQFLTKTHCKSDEYELCNWCDTHKPDSDSDDKSIRCVPASYHWFHCERVIAPPRERVVHKFEWGKKKKDEVVEMKKHGGDGSGLEDDIIEKFTVEEL